jgi:GrpB-like predicted nucleotidyltransferase (UPF0157 family)
MIAKYVFRKYKPVYKKYFTKEKLNLKKALGTKVVIAHIGSTAVPGLGGKGIVDIAVGIVWAKHLAVKKELSQSGYEYRATGSVPNRDFFRKDYIYAGRVRRVHLHVMQYLGKDWQRVIGFRDFLRTHPKAVKEYEKLKKQAVIKAKGVGEVYRRFKQSFIETNSKIK